MDIQRIVHPVRYTAHGLVDGDHVKVLDNLGATTDGYVIVHENDVTIVTGKQLRTPEQEEEVYF